MERPAAAEMARAGLYDRGSGPRGRFRPIRVADFSLKILSGIGFPILQRNQSQPTLEQPTFSPNVPAEIARARFRPRPMMITPIIHIPCHPTAGPSESVWAFVVELCKTSFKLGLKPLLQVITFLETTGAKASLFRLAHPSDQLQLPFVFCAVLAFAVLIVPVPAELLVCRPILQLAIDALKMMRWRRY